MYSTVMSICLFIALCMSYNMAKAQNFDQFIPRGYELLDSKSDHSDPSA